MTRTKVPGIKLMSLPVSPQRTHKCGDVTFQQLINTLNWPFELSNQRTLYEVLCHMTTQTQTLREHSDGSLWASCSGYLVKLDSLVSYEDDLVPVGPTET